MPPRDALLALGWAPPEKQTDLPGDATSTLSNASQRSDIAEQTSGGGSSPQAGQLGDIGKDANSETIDDITNRIEDHITRKAATDDDSDPSKTQGKGRGGRGKAKGQGRGRAAPTKKGKVAIKSEPPQKRKKRTPSCNIPKGPKPKDHEAVKVFLAMVRVA